MEQMPPGMLLVGNKQDLDEQNEREVSTETGETFAKVRGPSFRKPVVCCTLCTLGLQLNRSCDLWFPCTMQIYGAEFLESSAKTGYNVGTALLTLVR